MRTFVQNVNCVSFFLQLVIRQDEMFQECALLASHVIDKTARDKTQVFFDLLYQPVAVLQIQVSKTQNLLQVIGQKPTTDVQS
jgi:hypothetical protein